MGFELINHSHTNKPLCAIYFTELILFSLLVFERDFQSGCEIVCVMFFFKNGINHLIACNKRQFGIEIIKMRRLLFSKRLDKKRNTKKQLKKTKLS